MQATLRFLLALSLLVASACGDDGAEPGSGATPATEVNTLTITERDYSFDVEGDVEAGVVSIAVTNQGTEFHEIAMAPLREGVTLEEALDEIGSIEEFDEKVLGKLVVEDSPIDDLGGIQMPRTSYTITGSGIEAGEYLLLCFIPDPKGRPHLSLGMVDGFSVSEGDNTASPESDVTFTATDERLDGPTELPAGETTIEVVNDSSVNREINLLKIKEGSSVEDVGKWFESAGQGPPDLAASPLDFLAFVFDAEQDRRITVELTPGTWALSSSDPEKPFEGPPTEDPHVVLVEVTE